MDPVRNAVLSPRVETKTLTWLSSPIAGFDGAFKPDLAAPGGDIFSTFPSAKGSYTVMSGTSMAAPYVSGVRPSYLLRVCSFMSADYVGNILLIFRLLL